MDWSTRREQVRWYLRDHKWWWKWPVVVAIVAVWGAAFALFLRPWQPSPSSIDDTATPPTTTEVSDDDFPVAELPTGLDNAPPPAATDATEPAETEPTQVTMTLEELAASLPPLEAADTAAGEPTVNDDADTAPTSSRRTTRSAPATAEPEPVPTPIATPPPTTTRPRTTTTTTVRPSVNTPLPTFSTRPPSSPTTTVRPVTTTTTPPPTTPPPTTAPPTTAPPPTVATTLPPAPPPIVTLPATPPLEPAD